MKRTFGVTAAIGLAAVATILLNAAGIASIGEDTQQFRGLTIPPNLALCINTNAGSAVQAIVYFDQF